MRCDTITTSTNNKNYIKRMSIFDKIEIEITNKECKY